MFLHKMFINFFKNIFLFIELRGVTREKSFIKATIWVMTILSPSESGEHAQSSIGNIMQNASFNNTENDTISSKAESSGER